MGYRGPFPGTITAVLFTSQNPHSFNGLLLILEGPGVSIRKVLEFWSIAHRCLWSSNRRTRSNQPAQVLPSSCPGHPVNQMPPTPLPFFPLLPAKLISVSPGVLACQPVAGTSRSSASLLMSQGLWMVPCVTQRASSPNSSLTLSQQPTLVSSLAWFPLECGLQ